MELITAHGRLLLRLGCIRMMFILRSALLEDFEFLFALNRATKSDYVAQTWGKWDDDFQYAHFKKAFDPSHYQIVMMEGREVGSLWVDVRSDAVFLAEIQILPAFQNRGLGTTLVQEVIADANRRSLPVELQVLKVNPARRLYERLGFERFGETPTHIRMRKAI